MFVGLEVVAIICAVVLLKRAGRKQYLVPVIAVIVGLHFFGMVPALHSNLFWWVGGAMCVLSPATMSILSQRFAWPARSLLLTEELVRGVPTAHRDFGFYAKLQSSAARSASAIMP